MSEGRTYLLREEPHWSWCNEEGVTFSQTWMGVRVSACQCHMPSFNPKCLLHPPPCSWPEPILLANAQASH